MKSCDISLLISFFFSRHNVIGGDRILQPPNLTGDREKKAFGVWSWPSYDPSTLDRRLGPNVIGVPIIAHWRSVEPVRGVYKWDHIISKIEAAVESAFYVSLMLWISPGTPQWLFNEIGFIETDRKIDNFNRKTNENKFPHYDNYKFRDYFQSLIIEFAMMVKSLPLNLKSSILFIQVAEGSTGDPGGYKGNVILSSSQLISNNSREKQGPPPLDKTNYTKYRLWVWDLYLRHFQSFIPALVFNPDYEIHQQIDWILATGSKREGLGTRIQNTNIGLKMGHFSHGYHISSGKERKLFYLRLLRNAQVRGFSIFSRGEMDKEIETSGYAHHNIPQTLYWSALYALHNFLDIWNVLVNYVSKPQLQSIFQLFNRYAGQRDPILSRHAFIAFRQGLDASDTFRFPVARFGGAQRNNKFRYKAIQTAFSHLGARLEDVDAVIGKAMVNRHRKGYNDVGWKIFDSDYQRHLYLLPSSKSIPLWHVYDNTSTESSHFVENVAVNNSTLYGRFARAINSSQHLDLAFTSSFFQLHISKFLQSRSSALLIHLKIAIIYLDRGTAAFAIVPANYSQQPKNYVNYKNEKPPSTATIIRCTNSGQWHRHVSYLTLQLNDIKQQSSPTERCPHISIVHLGSSSSMDLPLIFHLVEIQDLSSVYSLRRDYYSKTVIPSVSPIAVTPSPTVNSKSISSFQEFHSYYPKSPSSNQQQHKHRKDLIIQANSKMKKTHKRKRKAHYPQGLFSF